MWQASYEHFAELCIDLVSRVKGLLPNALERAQFLKILLHLLICEGLSLWKLMLQRVYKLHCLAFECPFLLDVLWRGLGDFFTG